VAVRVSTTRRRADGQGSLSALADCRVPDVADHDGGSLDVAQLVRQASRGDRSAWERLVDQYSRLLWATTRDFRLSENDAADVVQGTWLRLLEHIDRIEYPERIGSWLATTARHECLRHLAAGKRLMVVQDDHEAFKVEVSHQPDVDERLLADERAQAVREALSTLPSRSQRLLELLMADPPASYTEISDQLGLPIGSIGPTRGRCLERLRLVLQTSLRRPWHVIRSTHRRRPSNRRSPRPPDSSLGPPYADPRGTAPRRRVGEPPARPGRPPGCQCPACAVPA
jgi:RNA polymerase sigma factor (sigma-70 family)